MLSWFVCSNIEFAFLCLSYFTELVVSIGDFCTLGYLVYCYLEMQMGILKCILEFFLLTYLLLTIFLLRTSLLYEFYFALLTESVCVFAV